jgi:mannose-6-phosphate isomerase-like protein (cupin superfamily)
MPLSLTTAIAQLTFLADRTPATTDAEAGGAFKEVAAYRDGGVFVGHWAGTSEWERHAAADEVVMVIEGATTIYFLSDQEEHSAPLAAGDLIVVPRNTWHRFETPDAVKLMSITPQPTDHRTSRPV